MAAELKYLGQWLIPLRSGYQPEWPWAAELQQRHGASAAASAVRGAITTVRASYALRTPEAMAWWEQFWSGDLARGANRVSAMLDISGTLTEYECAITDAAYSSYTSGHAIITLTLAAGVAADGSDAGWSGGGDWVSGGGADLGPVTDGLIAYYAMDDLLDTGGNQVGSEIYSRTGAYDAQLKYAYNPALITPPSGPRFEVLTTPIGQYMADLFVSGASVVSGITELFDSPSNYTWRACGQWATGVRPKTEFEGQWLIVTMWVRAAADVGSNKMPRVNFGYQPTYETDADANAMALCAYDGSNQRASLTFAAGNSGSNAIYLQSSSGAVSAGDLVFVVLQARSTLVSGNNYTTERMANLFWNAADPWSFDSGSASNSNNFWAAPAVPDSEHELTFSAGAHIKIFARDEPMALSEMQALLQEFL